MFTSLCDSGKLYAYCRYQGYYRRRQRFSLNQDDVTT